MDKVRLPPFAQQCLNGPQQTNRHPQQELKGSAVLLRETDVCRYPLVAGSYGGRPHEEPLRARPQRLARDGVTTESRPRAVPARARRARVCATPSRGHSRPMSKLIPTTVVEPLPRCYVHWFSAEMTMQQSPRRLRATGPVATNPTLEHTVDQLRRHPFLNTSNQTHSFSGPQNSRVAVEQCGEESDRAVAVRGYDIVKAVCESLPHPRIFAACNMALQDSQPANQISRFTQ